MTTLKLQYDSEDDIDEAFRPLFTEKDGKFNFTGIAGLKTKADIDKVNVGIKKEREVSEGLKTKLRLFGDGTVGVDSTLEDWRNLHSGIAGKLDTIPELEAAAKGNMNKDEIEEAVTRRLTTKMGPIERENATLKATNAEQATTIDGFNKADVSRSIGKAIHKELVDAKVRPEAFDDAMRLATSVFEIRADDSEIVTRDNVGFPPGLDPKTWLTDLQESRRHWWPESVGGGAGGSKTSASFGKNPFSHEHWSLTEQGRAVRENPKRADQMRKSAGVEIGGGRPKAKAKT